MEKLTGSNNYQSWKFNMEMLLIHEELYDCIDVDEATSLPKEKSATKLQSSKGQPAPRKPGLGGGKGKI